MAENKPEEAPKPKREPAKAQPDSKPDEAAHKSKKGIQIVGAIASTMGGFTLGTIIGWSSPAQDILIKDGVTETEFTHISSIMCLGAATAQLYLFFTFDRVGRKWTMITVAIPIIAVWLLMAFINNFIVFLLGRFVLGFCGGAFCVAAPTYIGEYSEKGIRGTLGIMFQLLLVIGIMFSFIMGLFSNRIASCFPMVIPPAICIVMMALMPESPVLLLQKGKREKAEKALQFYRGKHFDIKDDLEAIEDYLDCDAGGFRKNMKQPATRNGLLTLIAVHIYGRTCGLNVLDFYTEVLFQVGQVYGLQTSAIAIICIIAQILATFSTIFLVDKLGRRLLWLISSGTIAITTTLIGVYFLVLAYYEEKGKKLEYVFLWVVCFYMIGYGLGAGPLPWCMLGELPTPGVKHFIISLVVGIRWLVTYLFFGIGRYLVDGVGEGITFFIISGISVLGFVFIWFCVIETKGQTLYEVQESLKHQYKR